MPMNWGCKFERAADQMVANTLSESISDALPDPRGRMLQALFNRAVQGERLLRIEGGQVQIQIPRPAPKAILEYLKGVLFRTTPPKKVTPARFWRV
jgi:hypothetical protein